MRPLRFSTGETLQHIKRGGLYVVADFQLVDTTLITDGQTVALGAETAGKMAAHGWDGGPVTAQIDDATRRGDREIAVFYVAEDGRGWMRPKSEFTDNRFVYAAGIAA